MEEGGNEKGNEGWEKYLDKVGEGGSWKKPQPGASREERERFIRMKYVERFFFSFLFAFILILILSVLTWVTSTISKTNKSTIIKKKKTVDFVKKETGKETNPSKNNLFIS